MNLGPFSANPRISEGVFTRKYLDCENNAVCVAYHTPSQSVAFIEGDSAEVWWRLFSSNGGRDDALAYIREHGCFQSESDALAVLDDFLTELQDSNLINDKVDNHRRDSNVALGTDPVQNPELEIGQFMADHHIVYSLVLELTYRCNERCIHCYLPSNKRLPELSTSQVASLLQEFSGLGGMVVQLTGGELFVRKDIIEILRVVRELGLVTSITSNLTLLSDEMLSAVAELHPRAVGCSIYAPSAELHDSVTTVKGSFERSIRSIRALRAVGVPVIIKSPLMYSTAHTWREIEQLAQDLDCEYQFDLSITAKNDGGLSPVQHRVEDEALLQEIFASRYYKLYTGDEPMFTTATPSLDAGLCGAGAAGLCISPDGDVRPCLGLNLSLGRWPEQTLSAIWRSSKFHYEFGSIRVRDIPQCRECKDFAFCSRCPGAWYAEHGDFRTPTNYACKLAHIWAETQRGLSAGRKGGECVEADDEI